MKIRCASLSSGGGRNINDDTVLIRQDKDSVCAFVGDGLGGYAGGMQASQAAAQAVIGASRKGSLLTDERLRQAAEEAEQAVRDVQREKNGNMKTTLVTLVIEDGRARWMHIGDSRLYHFSGGSLKTQTMDHSVSQVAVLMGEIEPSQIRHHADRNRVLRALGSDNAKPDLSATVMLTGGSDAFLLCTDGFWEYVYEDEMEQLLCKAQNPQQWLDEMEKLLLSRAEGEHDNYTAAAILC